MKQNASNLRAMITPAGSVEKDPAKMTNLAADHYEHLFSKVNNIVRPHPYLHAPTQTFDNSSEAIPPADIVDLLQCAHRKKMKKSKDPHGISLFLLKFRDDSHWPLILDMINTSFISAQLPNAWKVSRMLLLAKKNSICPPRSNASHLTS